MGYLENKQQQAMVANKARMFDEMQNKAMMDQIYNKGISDEQYRRDVSEYAAYVDGLAKRRIAEQNAQMPREAAQMTPDQLATANAYAELDRRQADMGQINTPEPMGLGARFGQR